VTPNEKKLLLFLYEYQARFVASPTLGEIAGGIEVSSHQSASGIVDRLVAKGYLERGVQKDRSILLTDKAFEFLGVPLLRRERLARFNRPSISSTSSGSSVVNGVAHNFIGHGRESISTDGTNSADTWKVVVGNAIAAIATRVSMNREALPLFTWTGIVIALMCAVTWFIDDVVAAVVTVGVLAVLIKFLAGKINLNL